MKDGEAEGRHCVILDDLVQVSSFYLPYIFLISPLHLPYIWTTSTRCSA